MRKILATFLSLLVVGSVNAVDTVPTYVAPAYVSPCLVQTNCVPVYCLPSPFYISAFGGANWFKGKPSNANFKPGYVVGGALGYRFNINMRAEVEFSYRYNKVNYVKLVGQREHVHAHAKSYSGLANLYYDLPLDAGVTPYVGAGLGYTKLHGFAKKAGLTYKNSAERFSYQAIAGIRKEFYSNLSLSVEYRAHRVHNNSYSQSVGGTLAYNF